jgi:excisionase family DNA binding protein
VAAVTVEQAAEWKNVHRRTIYRWIKQGKIHVIRAPGGQLYLCQESLLAGQRSLGDRHDFSERDPRVRRVVELIERQYADKELTLRKLCRQLRLSYWQISRLLKAEKGSRFEHHLREVRMEKAAELLSATRLSNKEIAHDVGYKHESDFCHHFKQVYGLTPGEYRRNPMRMAHSVAGDGLESGERERERGMLFRFALSFGRMAVVSA